MNDDTNTISPATRALMDDIAHPPRQVAADAAHGFGSRRLTTQSLAMAGAAIANPEGPTAMAMRNLAAREANLVESKRATELDLVDDDRERRYLETVRAHVPGDDTCGGDLCGICIAQELLEAADLAAGETVTTLKSFNRLSGQGRHQTAARRTTKNMGQRRRQSRRRANKAAKKARRRNR